MKKRKVTFSILLVMLLVLTINVGYVLAATYYDKTVEYKPNIYTDYGLKPFPYKLIMHEATSIGSSSQNIFYHESYGSYDANLYGGLTNPYDLISWQVDVRNSYYSGSTEKLTILSGNWKLFL